LHAAGHGRWRALALCEDVLLIESASATDNPLVFAEPVMYFWRGISRSAARVRFDYAAIALADLMSMIERRTDSPY